LQHALRAFTPRDQKAVKTAADTFVPNPALDVAQTISQLAVGEALVSTLQEKGVPMPVERAMIAPPRSRIGAISPEERATVRGRSPVGTKYDTPVNRESAYERLTERTSNTPAAIAPGAPEPPARRAPQEQPREAPSDTTSALGSKVNEWVWGTKRRQGMVETLAKQTARTVGSQLGRQILRGVLGGIAGGSRRR
jgi:DNA helicase HerA-like ATPase